MEEKKPLTVYRIRRIIESTTLARVNYETFSCHQKLIKSACGHALNELLLLCFVYSVSSESKAKKKRENKSLQCV